MADDNAGSPDTKVDALKKACDSAFLDALARTSCSHAVWFVLKTLIDPRTPYRKANDLVRFMSSTTSPWQEVKTLDAAGILANQGTVVVGGKEEQGKDGHVIVVYPGPMIPGGGYKFQYKDKITGKMTTGIMPSHGLKPPCLSTSDGDWPGAVSKGDKNVLDPWGTVAKFAAVKFWTMNKP